MINQSYIRTAYSRMGDEELINLCKTEGSKLTGEAIQVLEEEFIKRNLNMEPVERLKVGAVLQHNESIRQLRESSTELYIESIWQYLLDEKKKGVSNHALYDGLLLKGLDEETALIVINDLEPRVERVLDVYKSEMYTGWVFLAIGVIGLFVINAMEGSNSLNFACAFLILGGLIRGIGAFLKMDTFRTILKNIKEENRTNSIFDMNR